MLQCKANTQEYILAAQMGLRGLKKKDIKLVGQYEGGDLGGVGEEGA